MNALLLDLDDTLLDYSGGVDDSWRQACAICCAPIGLDVEILMKALVDTRQWFWRDPSRHRQERVNMVRAWQRIAGHALESLGIARDSRARACARSASSSCSAAIAVAAWARGRRGRC